MRGKRGGKIARESGKRQGEGEVAGRRGTGEEGERVRRGGEAEQGEGETNHYCKWKERKYFVYLHIVSTYCFHPRGSRIRRRK